MILKNSTIEDLVAKIHAENRSIIVYGAGMIGTVYIPYFIEEYSLNNNLICFFDVDKRKQRNVINIGKNQYLIRSPEEIKNISSDTIILITNSNYYPIVKMMDSMTELEKNEAYIIPVMQVFNACKVLEKQELRKSEKQLIPKKIHYCWFSKKEMPDYLKYCIESWYKYCPNFKIVRWDENNYNIGQNSYMKEAYFAKKWGFVPDIARLDILYNEGGIYLDTDVELLKPLDELLYQQAFTGVEKWGSINMGGCSGAVAKHPIIKQMLDYRINEHFILDDGSFNQTTCGYYETKPLMQLGMKPNNTKQTIGNMTIYTSDFFHPYDYMSGETSITENTFSIHHFSGGWIDEKNMLERKKTSELFIQIVDRMKR